MNPVPRRAPVVGTDALGRAFTNEERSDFEKLLREHDFTRARDKALEFGRHLTRSRQAAEDLVGRASLRLVRSGWDPNAVTLVRRMCRLVWSEWTNSLSENDTRRGAEEVFLRTQEAAGLDTAQSAEVQALRMDRRRDATAQLDELQRELEKAKDEVNLLWLEYSRQGEDDLQKMAAASGRPVTEFYAAAKRRQRIVRRLLAAKRGIKLVEKEP